ncbi:phosphodiester glycosidase family protein [Arcicella aurantiaca]|nr:phosphodiester glycosidase family protein [Arcicella aurantiaca]
MTAYLLTVFFVTSNAQNYADSLMLSYVRWFPVDLGNGLLWKSYHFNQKELFASNQNINILQTKLSNKSLQFAFGSADTYVPEGDTLRKLKPTSVLALENNAIAAVNGGFFNTKRGGAVDFIKINKKILDSASYSPDRLIPEHSIAAITIDENNMKIVKGGAKLYWEKSLPENSILVTGPLLIHNNEVQELRVNAFNDNRHPRTCACITNEDDLLLITVDGRNAVAQGMTLHELTFLTRMLNCKDAVNLDGGGSTTMYVKGQNEDGVVNYPCDNKQFDHRGERAVSNVVMILKK